MQMIEISDTDEGKHEIWKLKHKINDIRSDILHIHKQQWDIWYKTRCPEHYLSFEQFIDKLAFMNSNQNNRSEIEQFKNECKYEVDECHIPCILDVASKYGFKDFSPVYKMICEACACQGCPYMEEHLGHTCNDCRKNGYQMYEGYCDE